MGRQSHRADRKQGPRDKGTCEGNRGEVHRDMREAQEVIGDRRGG